MKVNDVMRKEVVTIDPEASLRSAARLIFSGHLGGLPVVNKGGKLVGIVVEKDILTLFFPSLKEYIEDYIHAKDFELMEETISETLDLPVKKFMSHDPLTVFPQTPLLRAVSLMITKRISKLPVVAQNKKLVGIISQGDIFGSIVREKIPSLKGRIRRGANFFSRFAKHYDISFSWDQRLAQEVPFLIKQFKKEGVKTVVDLGCGTGEHAIALAKRGFSVVGVDNNEEMLANAKEKWAKQREGVRKNLEFLKMAIADVASLKERRIDAAICLGNMLPNVLDYDRELVSLRKTLNSKAVFIAQIRNFDRIMTEKERFISLDFSFPEAGTQWEKEYAFLRFYDFRRDGLLDFNVETLVNDGKDWRSYGAETTIQKPVLMNDFRRILTKLGFGKIQFFGDFEGKKYDKEKSGLLIVVARH